MHSPEQSVAGLLHQQQFWASGGVSVGGFDVSEAGSSVP